MSPESLHQNYSTTLSDFANAAQPAKGAEPARVDSDVRPSPKPRSLTLWSWQGSL